VFRRVASSSPVPAEPAVPVRPRCCSVLAVLVSLVPVAPLVSPALVVREPVRHSSSEVAVSPVPVVVLVSPVLVVPARGTTWETTERERR